MNGIEKHNIIALDSNIFIYHFEDNPDFVPYTQKIFDRVTQTNIKIITSIVSVIEALSYPSPPQVIKLIEQSFQSTPNLAILNVDHDIAVEAANIRRNYGFRLPDAVQLATAKYTKADAFIGNDRKFKQFKEIPVILLTEL